MQDNTLMVQYFLRGMTDVIFASEKYKKKDINDRRKCAIEALNHLKLQYGIEYNLYDNSVVLNYGIIASDQNSQIVKECRALQLSFPDFNVISLAFDRFFNYGEKGQTDDFDFDGAVVFDKIDGSLVIFYYSPITNKWEVATRKMAFAEGRVNDDYTFRDLILSVFVENEQLHGDRPLDIDDDGEKISSIKQFDNIEWLDNSDLDKSKSYVFEFVSPETKIVTPYKDRRLYYLSTFDNRTKEEPSYNEGYNYVNKYIPCIKVTTYNFSNINNIVSMASKLLPVEEGFVVRNKYNDRIKVKNPAYVALHLLRFNGEITDKRMLEILESPDFEEYLTYYPEDKEKFETIKTKKKELFEQVTRVYEKIKDIEVQKDFALEATKYPFSGMLFILRQGKELPEIWETTTFNKKLSLLGIKE